MTSVERMAPVPSMSSIVVLDDDENDGYTPRPPQVSLTPEQLQRMARQRELALTRRMQREQQQLLQEGGRILPLSSGYPRQEFSPGNFEESSMRASRNLGSSLYWPTERLSPRSGGEESHVVCLSDWGFQARGASRVRTPQGSCIENPVCLDSELAVPRSSSPPHAAPNSTDGWISVRKRPVPGQSFGRQVATTSAAPLVAADPPAMPNKRVKVEENTTDPGHAAEPGPVTDGPMQDGREAVNKKVAIKPSQQQMLVLKAIEEGKSVFVTGSAGTGKSFLLEYAIRLLKMKHGSDGVFVTASTGMAACAVGGTTLHSFAGIMPNGKTKEQLASALLHETRYKEARHRWHRAKALIIDEISMIDGEFFDKLEHIARAVKMTSRAFGGLQLVVTGDFFQLPPVEKKKGFAFEAATWRQCFDIQLQLTEVFRQEDQEFVAMLNEIRTGVCSRETHIRLLKCSGNIATNESAAVQHTKLYPHKDRVTHENDANLKSINEQKYAFPAKDEIFSRNVQRTKEMVEKLGVDPMIRLCVGAQVMLLKNLDTASGLVNGARGVVVDFCTADDPRAAAFVKFTSPCGMWPLVKFAAGKTRVMGPESWSVKEGEEELGRRNQVPLSLAWALSVHKCQGMTLDRVDTDLSKSFDYGMIYVALSRVKSLEGLRLTGFNPKKIQVDPKVKMFYDKLHVSQH